MYKTTVIILYVVIIYTCTYICMQISTCIKIYVCLLKDFYIEVGSPPPRDVEDDAYVTTSSPNYNGATSPLWDKVRMYVCVCKCSLYKYFRI